MTQNEQGSADLAIKKLQQDVARSVDRKREKQLSWTSGVKHCQTPQN